ncbi:MAG: endo-1,4-beta-xylanase [Clostridia bacterium]|nr:endo-1,4-beta-xylanase [Clostridia bacterium]
MGNKRSSIRRKWTALLLALMMLFIGMNAAAGEENATAYEKYLAGGGAPSLAQRYEGIFTIGVATSPEVLQDERAASLIAANFNSLTCENQMKADFVMDRSASIRSKDNTRVKLNFSKAAPVLSFAQEHGMKVRAHTLVWHSQTPRWFFAESWSNMPNAPLVDRETMLLRMENYIRDEMEYVNAQYPGVVYAWDVVNEAIDPGMRHPAGIRTEGNLWYEVIGEDYLEWAFAFARKYADPDQKLFYNDYNCTQLQKLVPLRKLLKDLHDKGILDGLGMQSHLGVDSPSLSEYQNALNQYASLGITIHVTELDVSTADNSPLGQMRLAYRYRSLLSLLMQVKTKGGYDIGNVTVWGLKDDQSWLNSASEKKYPLLFGKDYNYKPAFFGALLDASIPMTSNEAKLREAVEKLGLDKLNEQEGASVNVYKTLNQHNPVMVQRFGADPWAMIYGDRVYLYMTGDEPMMTMDGKPKTNDYSNITTLRVLSSDDLVNWQDHGSAAAAGKNGAAKWAANSWAPCAAWKTIDGKDKFFLYFANSGGGIGVLVADDPAGPFTDPLGKALISRATPTCAEVTWLFDPAVLVDDDGSAYLYFGGGVPNGKADDPGTARVVKLGEDMISLDGDPVAINPPWLFEDSGINKFGDTYAYSYCSNFNVPSSGSEQGFQSGEIVYMTSESPMGPFVFGGRVLQNPGAYFGVGGNNHHCMFEFRGKTYITYHAATVDKAMGWNAGYRSTFVDVLNLNENGLPTLSQGTYEGVEQVKAFDPYAEVPASTLASLAGMETALVNDADKAAGTGDMLVRSTASGGWIGIAGVDFGQEGADGVKITWMAEEGAKLEILLDSLDSEPAACIDLSAAGEDRAELFALPETITGVHDLYFRFSQPNVSLLQWQFFSPLQDQ